jgi:hypothetical protein
MTNPNLPYPRNAEGKLGLVGGGSVVAMRSREGKARGRDVREGKVRKGGIGRKGEALRRYSNVSNWETLRRYSNVRDSAGVTPTLATKEGGGNSATLLQRARNEVGRGLKNAREGLLDRISRGQKRQVVVLRGEFWA